MKTYKEYKISTTPFEVDLLSGMLWQLDIDGINEYDNYLSVFVGEAKQTSRNDIEDILQHMISENMISSFQIEEQSFEEINWNEEYEKKVKVVEISERIVIKPSFKEYDAKPNQLIITIDPKMSFGTGEHATTKLVLQHLEKIISGNEKVLDVGSGTGVLGIAPVLLGAQKSICVDNDEWCLMNGTENVKANHLEEKVEIHLGELKDIRENDFDVIVANINKHILDTIAADLRLKIKKTGTLILSGLLISDESSITSLYQSIGFRLIDSSSMDEWIALVFNAE